MIESQQASLREAIRQGHTALGIEFGSTRIKAVLTGPDNAPIATGSHDWENQFVDRLWTYSLDAVANAYHASSHRKQMSGLIASTSSITRRGL